MELKKLSVSVGSSLGTDVRKTIFFPLTTTSRILLAKMEQNKTQEKTKKAIN